MVKRVKVVLNLLISLSVVTAITSFSTTPASAYAGTLENGNLAFAAGSGFDKGEACNYLPGFESGYDAWHFVLTSRGATFQQSPTNPAIAINLNFVFMRLDGSIFVIKSGAWVQTGKGAYTYTPVQDRIRMVQAGSVAQINGLDSGMRLSHTCPGTGVAATTASPTPTPSPTPTATASPSPTSTATRSPSPSPSPTSTATRSPSPSPSPTSSRRPSPSPTPSPTPTATRTPSPTPSPSATVATPTPTPTPTPTGTPSLRPRPTPTPSATQSHPAGNRNPLPTPTPTPQPLIPTPTPSPSPSASQSPSPSPSPSASATPSPEPTTAPPVVPSPPPIEDPKKLEYIDPEKPKDIDPQKFPDPPASPVVITQEPKYGTITENPNGTFTYVPTPQPKPVVDVVEFQYTNLNGTTVVVRKEFLAIQKGDVPSIIQTGPTSNNSHSGLLIAIFAILAAVTVKRSKFHG